MSRVTSKLQVTIPKEIARRYGIEPGVEIDWLPAGDAIRVVPPTGHRTADEPTRRLELFDAATAREELRHAARSAGGSNDRGWSREGLYGRGVAD